METPIDPLCILHLGTCTCYGPMFITSPELTVFKTHHYIIFVVRPLHSKPGTELLLIKYTPIIMVGLWRCNLSGVIEL